MRLYRGGEGEFDNIKLKIEHAITEIEPLVKEYEQNITRHTSLEKLHDDYDMNKKKITNISYNSPNYNRMVYVVTLKSSAARILDIENRQKKIENEMRKIETKQGAHAEQLSVIDNLLSQLDKLLADANNEVKELDTAHDNYKYVSDTSQKFNAYKSRVNFVTDKIKRLPFIEPISRILEKAKKPFYDPNTIDDDPLTQTGMYGNIPRAEAVKITAESEVPKAAPTAAEAEAEAARKEAATARAWAELEAARKEKAAQAPAEVARVRAEKEAALLRQHQGEFSGYVED
jgi:DNA repair exonuclease SbcCD ATPase subunit